MAQVIQIKRRIPGTGKPASGTGAGQVTVGELATSISATGASGVANLYVGDGTYVHDLVSDARQVELDGAQTIVGAKTIGAAGSLTSPVANLHVQGGNAGDILSTNGAGVHTWVAQPAAGIPAFSTSATYAIGNFVSYGGHIYRALAANGPGAWDPQDWDRVATLSDLPVIEVGTTAPTPAAAGDLWFNTTTQQLMAYTGSVWVLASRAYVGTTAPASPATGTEWFDTNAGQNLLKVWTGAVWAPAVDVPIQDFSATATYVIGDLVIHGGHIYRATVAVPAGPWDPQDWAQITGTGIESLHVQAPISGNGLTAGTALGVTMATTAEVDGGSDTVKPISPATLRSQIIGGVNGVASLNTTAKLVVPAINELDGDITTLTGQIAALSGALRMVGTYDADGSEVVSADAGTLTVGSNLPAAAAGNRGWFVIVTDQGTPTAPAPAVLMAPGDWIVSTGAIWIHVPLHHAAVIAPNVGMSPAVGGWNNVQDAIAGLNTAVGNRLTTVHADQISIWGDGTAATAPTAAGQANTRLEVHLVDGGAY